MKLRVLKDPPKWHGAYTLYLYCNHDHSKFDARSFPHIFHGETLQDCKRQAWNMGWRMHRDYTAACPNCSMKVII